MKFTSTWQLLLVIVTMASCVSNKKFNYLQHADVNKKELPKDTVLRSYSVNDFDYKIQPQDVLSVRFESLTSKDYDFLSKESNQQNLNLAGGGGLVFGELVDNEGEIPLPVLGKQKVAGMTVFQVQDSLQALANQYMESPLVKVRLINFRITLLGEVNREGSVVFQNNRVSMIEAIALGGGLTDLGDKRNVKLIRQKGGQLEISYINLLDENFINSPFFYVHQNDVLIVPPLKQRPFRKYFGQNLGVIVSTLSLIILVYNLTN